MEVVELRRDSLRQARWPDKATAERSTGLRHDDVGSVERAAGDVDTAGSSAAAHERPRIRMRHGDRMGWEEEVARGPVHTVAGPAYSWDRCAAHEAGDRSRSHRHRRIQAVVAQRLLPARAPRESKRAFARGWRWRRARNSGYVRSPWVGRAAGSGGRTHGG